jgi:preprotein translocase subunit YajC
MTKFFLADGGANNDIGSAYSGYSTIIMIILMFVLFYFLLIRPNQKRQKQRQQMINSLQKGDKVVTIGGLHGTIHDLDDTTVVVKVSENVKLTFDRQAVNAVIKD